MEVEAAGGDMNAYTSLDQTVYYINMATRFAAKGLEILADAVMNPLFDSEELKRESEVILEEIGANRIVPLGWRRNIFSSMHTKSTTTEGLSSDIRRR